MKKLLTIVIMVSLFLIGITTFSITFTGLTTQDCNPEHKALICHITEDDVKILCVDKNGWNGHDQHKLDTIITDLNNDGNITEQDCSLLVSCTDQDGDGFCDDKDCNDNDKTINPNQPELCNNIDDNCNKLIDEELKKECGTDIGICTTGYEICQEGNWKPCTGIQPKEETCNNLDDNCDGQADEGCSCNHGEQKSCGTSEGSCQAGTQTCIAGIWQDCTGEITPTEETCNNLDDDCDGSIDEELTMECGEYLPGVCSQAVKTCNEGVWSECIGQVQPTIEECNDLDDDCDGSVDESLSEVCGTTDIGECEYGLKTCTEGIWQECIGNIEPTAEICNSLDDDCDGIIDNNLNCECNNSETRVCGIKEGICTEGLQTCTQGQWSECNNATLPTKEICNSLDDDCDGTTDEGVCQVLTPSGGSGGGSKGKKEEVKVSNVVKNQKTSKTSSNLKIEIEKAPETIDIQDKKVILQAKVTNTGTTQLNNIKTEVEQTEGWTSKTINIESLKPNEEKIIDIEIQPEFCQPTLSKQERRLSTTDINILAKASSQQTEAQTEIIIPLNIPKIAVTSAINDYSKNNKLKACFFINNLEQEARDVEIEFEVDDHLHDVLIDYLTPIKLNKDEILIKEKVYTISNVPENKVYEIKAGLYEDGKLFEKGYQSGHSSENLDLTRFKKESLFTKLKNFFKKR